MRVGIDGIVLEAKASGSLRYFKQLLAGIAWAGLSNDYVIFTNEQSITGLSSFRQPNFHLKHVNTKPYLPGAIQQQLYTAWHFFGNLDLLHSPLFIPPLKYQGRTIMTVFDVTFRRYPQSQKWTGRFWWRLLGQKGIQSADRLIAISESTKNDLRKFLNIPEEKIAVIYPYVSPSLQPVSNPLEHLTKYQLTEPFILFVGTLERRKNLAALIRAFAIARQDASIQHKLVLAGQRGWLYEDVFREIDALNIGDDVIFLNYVPENDLPALYSAADLFVYLSHYEGFGYPVLEAMACGVPVLTSNTSSLPEVIGDAGVAVPPDDVEGIAIEIRNLLTNPERRVELREKGFIQAHSFSIERFSEDILAAYNQAVSMISN